VTESVTDGPVGGLIGADLVRWFGCCRECPAREHQPRWCSIRARL